MAGNNIIQFSGNTNEPEEKSPSLSFALVNVVNKSKNHAMNKDLNGGFGTADDYGNSLLTNLIKRIKKKYVNLPIISFAFLQSILKNQGHKVDYFEGLLPNKKYDIILVYGTIVDCYNENETCKKIKQKFPETLVGVFGPFPSRNPEIFNSADFVFLGEAESFFMNDFSSIELLKGKVQVTVMTDMNNLPQPDYGGFPINKYRYIPAIFKKPFLVLQASKGCPYSCRYYCTYGEYQGARIRQRSPNKVVDDIVHLKKKYDAKGIQFRDPTFGLNRDFIPEFCKELKERKVNIIWGMETRLDLLTEEKLRMMYDVGLRNVNIGIETSDKDIAKKNKRLLVQETHQDKMIRLCNDIGIKVSAFYIIGYEGDTAETIRKTVDYAISLNTPVARFSVSTPYPGTGFYAQLEKEDRIISHDLTKYTQFNLVFNHPNFTPEQLNALLQKAYHRYYFRLGYFVNFVKWRIKEFLS